MKLDCTDDPAALARRLGKDVLLALIVGSGI